MIDAMSHTASERRPWLLRSVNPASARSDGFGYCAVIFPNHVVASECVDSQSVIRWFCTRDIDPCSQAEYRRAICVTSDRNHITPAGAIDNHVVGLTIATAAGGLEVDVNFGDVGTR